MSSFNVAPHDPASNPTPDSSPASSVSENGHSVSKDKHVYVETSHDDSTTCIVCLVDLPETSSDDSVGDSFDHVARLVPCNHVMHNRCLSPWVQRANSCPICRRSFNCVRLHSSLSSPMISEYTVENRTQRPDTDLNFLDEDEVETYEFERCLLCDDSRDNNHLIVCDCCAGSFHTFCCDLPSFPEGDWFCPLCVSMQYHQSIPSTSQRSQRPTGRRPIQRQSRYNGNWAGVWQDVWSHMNRDVNHDQVQEEENDMREAQLRDWDRRVRIAQAQGAEMSAFCNVVPQVIGCNSRPWEKISADAPDSEEAEEAWKALDEFRAIESGCGEYPERKRRASGSQGPAADEGNAIQQSERKLKRPRTKPNSVLATSTQSFSSSPPTLQSSPQPSSVFGTWLNKLGNQGDTSDSVQVSLTTSSMPNALSASPSRISPQFPPFSFSSPSFPPASPPGTRSHSPLSLARRSAFSPSPPNSPSSLSTAFARSDFRPTSPDSTPSSSPSRLELTMPMKEEIQAIVRSVLRPFYQSSKIDTDQYTEINKGVSRHLYELVGSRASGISFAFIENQEERQRLKSIAEAEVEVAVGRMSPK